MRHPCPRFNLTPLSLAVALALTVPGFVQAETGDNSKAVSLSIATQSLGSALNELSAATGVPIAFSPALVAGKTAPAVKGSLTLRQALGQLLAGSGLAASEDGTSIVIKNARSASDQESTLPAVKVTAQTVRDGTTEGTGSYTTSASSTATKLNLSPRETPQTLTVVTRQKMDDFGLSNVNNVLESTSAIAISENGNNGPTYYSRGFRIQSQYDGIPNPIGIGENNRGPSPDTAFLDKIEILQGASGLMSGAGEPGGTINMVQKRPTEQFAAHIETELGSWNKKRLVGDVSGPLIESGKARARVVAFVDRSDSFTDYVFENKQGLYGIVEADLTENTTVGASILYQKNEFNMHYGVPMEPDGKDLGLPRSSFFGVKNGDSTRESTTYALSLEQKLPADWNLKSAYTHSDIDVDKVANFLDGTLDPITGDGLNLWRTPHQRKFKSDSFDIYGTGPFQLFGRKHELVIGATTAKMEDNNRLVLPYTQSPINIYNFNGASISRPSGDFRPWWSSPNETIQKGAYGATRLNVSDALKLIVGMRISWYEYKAQGVSSQKEDGVITPYAGLIYDIDNSTSVYVSYSDIFKPQSNLKYGGGSVDPIVGKNYELGIKKEFLQGRLNASAAVFRLEQTNLAEIDDNAPATACNGDQCYTASGLVVSKGVDLAINGELAPDWQVGAGYAYVNNEYGNGVNKGQSALTYMPKHILRLHTSYKIPGTDWTVGGNIRSQSGINYTDGATFNVRQGSYTIAGLMAKYRINRQADIVMRVENIFDKTYYSSVGYPMIGNFYGAPRSFAVNLKYAF